MAIWNTIYEWFFWIFFLLFCPYLSFQLACFWGPTGSHLSFKTNFNAIRPSHTQFFKFQKFFQIKNVKMRIIDTFLMSVANSSVWKYLENCVRPTLLKVRRIMYNKCKKVLEFLITMKSAISVAKMICCPF